MNGRFLGLDFVPLRGWFFEDSGPQTPISSGSPDIIGEGPGKGFNLNIPLEGGYSERGMTEAVSHHLEALAEAPEKP